MARIPGADPAKLGFLHGLFTRLVYRITKRKLSKTVGRDVPVIVPVQVNAHHARILWGYLQMTQAQMAGSLVDSHFKHLAELRAATLIGCPF